MSTRSINVVHLLVPRRINGAVQFLFSPHPRWRGEDGRPLLALPAKKFHGRMASAGEARRLDDALSGIVRDDLGLPDAPSSVRQRLDGVRMHLVSPALRTPTEYAISPVLARVPPARHAAVARRLHGEWLTPSDALRQADLSPTARLVLERTAAVACESVSRPPEMLLGSAPDRAWTEQLLLAQDGDLPVFGSLFEEIKPHLSAYLYSCSWTQALTRCSADVEDALHEAALNALEHLHTFDPSRGAALVWLWSITRNCAVSALRKQIQDVNYRKGQAQTAAHRFASAALDPQVLAEAKEELALVQSRVAAALQAADPVGRQIWQMRFDDGLPYATIAARLNMPLGSIATHIHRLRKNSQGGACGRDR